MDHAQYANTSLQKLGMENWSDSQNQKTITLFEGQIFIFVTDCSNN